jgi:ribosome-binding protein aMBF1 (putative translation factor)
MRRLTKERELKGWSRSELARRARMTPADVGKIEAGRLAPYDSQLRKLARALGIPGSAARLLEEVSGDHHGTAC